MTDPNQSFAPTPEQSPAPAADAPNTPEQGNWFHRHRWFTKEPITYAGYQLFRSTMATIPYGLAMATVHRLMGWARVTGEKHGLSEPHQSAGVAAFDANIEKRATLQASLAKAETPQAIAAVERELAPVAQAIEAAMVPGRKAALWRGVSRIAASPLNQALQIGAGFTLFRFVGGLVKGQRDKMMNENNTAEDTNRETRNWWQNIKSMAKMNWVAESTGTPVAALTLGFASANFKPVTAAIAQKQTLANGVKETFGQAYKRAVLSPQAKVAQNAAIWTIAYSIFFEASERIFKDMQLKRGKWQGNANSLKNAPNDPNVGGYAADGHTKEYHEIHPPPKPKLDILTGDPSICRFVFRRVLPVAVGITGYAFAKRGGYIAAGGPMEPVTHADINKGLGANLKLLGRDYWREGLATATFGVLWMATDAWGSWYDKFFAKMQDSGAHQPLNEHQMQKVTELQQQLHAKETDRTRANDNDGQPRSFGERVREAQPTQLAHG